MSDKVETRSFDDLKSEIGADGSDRFAVRSRGRPEMDPNEAHERNERQKAFGRKMKELREARGLTLAAVAEEAGLASARKLSQYETKCYPPGWVLSSLAPIYGVNVKYLAALKVANSDPHLFAALSDGLTPEDFAENDFAEQE